MPLYIDRHKNVNGLTAEAVADAHRKDLEVQDNHDAKALRHWFNEEKEEVLCLIDAPSVEAAADLHREARGLMADEITEVEEGSYLHQSGPGFRITRPSIFYPCSPERCLPGLKLRAGQLARASETEAVLPRAWRAGGRYLKERS